MPSRLSQLVRSPLAWWMVGLLSLGAVVAAGGPYVVETSRLAPSFRERPDLYDRLAEGPDETSSWKFSGLFHHPSGFKILLAGETEAVFVRFVSADRQRPYGLIRGPWFAYEVPQRPLRDPEQLVATASRLAGVLESLAGEHDPWVREQRPTSLPGAVYSAALAGLLGVLVWLGISRCRKGVNDWPFLLALLGIFSAAFLFRWLCSMHAPLHENLHGLEEMDHLILPAQSPYPNYSGRCQEGLADLLFLVFPQTVGAFWRIGETIGAAGALAGAVAAWRLFESRAAAIAVGLALAFSPHLARVSTSESPFGWACLLLPVCLASTVAYVTLRDWRLLLASFLSNLLAVHLHLTTSPFLLLPLLVLAGSAPAARRQVAPHLAGLFVAGAILSIPHLHSQWLLNVSEGLGSVWTDPAFLLRPLSEHNLFFHPGAAPLTVSLLSGMGLLLAWIRFRRSARMLTLGLPLLLPLFAATTCIVDLVRYQSVAAVWLTLPLGAVAGAMAGLASVRLRIASAVLLCAALAVELPHVTAAQMAPDVEAQQFLFMQDCSAKLPQRGLLVLPPRVREYRAVSYFPGILLADAGKALVVVHGEEFQERVRRDGWPEGEVFYFESLSIHQVEHALQDPELSDIPREEVARIEGRLAAWEAFLSRHTEPCIATRMVASPPRVVSAVPMEFNRQPDGAMQLSLCRLSRTGPGKAPDAVRMPWR